MASFAQASFLILTAHRWSRIGTFTSFYIAQGIPIGIFSIAVPFYLSEEGYSLSEMSAYSGIIGLPWAFKLIVGPFMDRFTFLPMGFRRPWVILAQTNLVCCLVAFTLFCVPGNPNLYWLTVFGFLCNVCTASQDVATDGMAIDILHDDERGRANAFMGFGQTVGSGAFGALSGFLLVKFNMAVVAFAATSLIAIIWFIAIITRERAGERLLPWTKGTASPITHYHDPSFKSIVRDLLRVVFLPMSLILILMELFNRMRDGVAMSVIPKYAEEVLEVSKDEYTFVVGIVSIVSAVVAVFIGPLIDKYGAKRFVFYTLIAGALVHVVAWFCSSEGFGLLTMTALYTISAIVGQLIFVTTIAIFMTICWKRVAATQFAIYMSLANLSRSIGAALFALVASHLTLELDFLLMAVLLVLAAIMVSSFNPEEHKARLEQLA